MAHAINLNVYADTTEQPGIFGRLRQSFADHRKYLATYDELNALSDRELADLGPSTQTDADVGAIAGNGCD
jgi:uncharacterized protein YjiS (DUF1127 family)